MIEKVLITFTCKEDFESTPYSNEHSFNHGMCGICYKTEEEYLNSVFYHFNETIKNMSIPDLGQLGQKPKDFNARQPTKNEVMDRAIIDEMQKQMDLLGSLYSSQMGIIRYLKIPAEKLIEYSHDDYGNAIYAKELMDRENAWVKANKGNTTKIEYKRGWKGKLKAMFNLIFKGQKPVDVIQAVSPEEKEGETND